MWTNFIFSILKGSWRFSKSHLPLPFSSMVIKSTYILWTSSMNNALLVVSAIFQGGVFGLAGKFPAEYINAMVSGQALGGIFASLSNIISIALGASAVQSAFLYFLAADFTLFLSFGLYAYLSQTVIQLKIYIYTYLTPNLLHFLSRISLCSMLIIMHSSQNVINHWMLMMKSTTTLPIERMNPFLDVNCPTGKSSVK